MNQKEEENEAATWRKITSFHQRNIFLAKDVISKQESDVEKSDKEKFVSLIKNYSISDVQGLIWLSEKLDKIVKKQGNSYILDNSIKIQGTSFD